MEYINVETETNKIKQNKTKLKQKEKMETKKDKKIKIKLKKAPVINTPIIRRQEPIRQEYICSEFIDGLEKLILNICVLPAKSKKEILKKHLENSNDFNYLLHQCIPILTINRMNFLNPQIKLFLTYLYYFCLTMLYTETISDQNIINIINEHRKQYPIEEEQKTNIEKLNEIDNIDKYDNKKIKKALEIKLKEMKKLYKGNEAEYSEEQ